jgi:hypothetical protein
MESINEVLAGLKLPKQNALNTQTKVGDNNCQRCGENNGPTKDKIICGKTHHSICADCWRVLSAASEEQRDRLSFRLDCRKNIFEAMRLAGVPERYMKCDFSNFIGHDSEVKKIREAKKTEKPTWL